MFSLSLSCLVRGFASNDTWKEYDNKGLRRFRKNVLLDPDHVGLGRVFLTSSPVWRPIAAEPTAYAVVELATEFLFESQMLTLKRGRCPIATTRRMEEANL